MTHPQNAAAAAVLLPILNNSRVKCHRACDRKHYYAYELGLRAVRQDEVLHFGTVFHMGLEEWWKWLKLCDEHPAELSREDALDVALVAIRKGDLDPYTLAKAEVLMAFYHERWIDAPYEVIDVEAKFTVPLVNPETGRASRTWQLGGTLDVLTRHRVTRDFWNFEHKTSGEDLAPESSYWDRLRMNSQISTYMVGARAILAKLGHDPEKLAGTVYDVIGKPDKRPLQATPEESRKYTQEKWSKEKWSKEKRDRKTKEVIEPAVLLEPSVLLEPARLYANQRDTDETVEEYRDRLLAHVSEDPERYINRAIVVRLEAEEREAAADVWMRGYSIRQAQRLGFWPRNDDACELYRRRCEYWQVCVGQASINDPALYAPREDKTNAAQ